MRQDLRFALRMIGSHRWFSAAIVVTLALGIGVNTMVFTLVNAVLFKPVPVPNGARLIVINNRKLADQGDTMPVSYPDFREFRARNSSLQGLEAASQDAATLSESDNPPQRYNILYQSAGLFPMLGVQPALGRGFRPSEDQPGAAPVLLLGSRVWKERYHSDPAILGHVVRVNGKPATIIGVMPEGFRFPSSSDLWMPLQPTAEIDQRSNRSVQLYGILQHGVAIPQASDDLGHIAARLAAAYPEDKAIGIRIQTFHERFNGGNIRIVFLLMLAAVGFVLLIACANVANMMLSRALSRRREMSIRAAIGASRWHVIRQLLIESVMLSLLGGLLGLGLSMGGVHAVDLATQDVGKPYWVQFTMDFRVFGYFAALCVASGMLFGLAPAIRTSRVDLNDALRDGVRTAGSPRGGRLSTALVVFQFALTLVLLTGAGVFARSFVVNQEFNSFVPAGRLLSARLNLPADRYPDAASRLQFYDRLLPRLNAIPGVTQASLTTDLPGLGSGRWRIEVEHAPATDVAHAPVASPIAVSPGYFREIHLTLLAGREFNDLDGRPGHLAAVVTRDFAERFWPGQSSLGKRVRLYTKDTPGDWLEVVGMVSDLIQNPTADAPVPLLFVPYRQTAPAYLAILLRTAGNPANAAGALRATVQGLDEDLPLYELRTMTESLDRQFWFLRVFGSLFGTFALIALLMASVGIYAVMAQATSRRTQEIGVRMALGATSRNILALVLRRGLWQLAAGLLLGLGAAYPAARLMTRLPLGVSASDPLVLGSVSLALAAVGAFACWLPARRAATLDPLNAIRYE